MILVLKVSKGYVNIRLILHLIKNRTLLLKILHHHNAKQDQDQDKIKDLLSFFILWLL